jgi:short-subunit dehydrogenase
VTAPFTRALITGASSGIGRSLALWFARRGVTVYAAARRKAQLEGLQAEAPEQLVPLVLDVANADATHARIQALDAEVGGFDLVVANAGIGDQLPAKDIAWSRVRRVLDVNVMGATATLCAVIPGMLQRGRGHLVGVSSLAAFISLPKVAAYNASKSYLTAWLESVRLDLEPEGLFVTSIHPGFVKSELTAKNRFKMPFILETDDAADRMGRAIVRRDPFYSFPAATQLAASLASALPRPIQRFLGKRVR